MNIIHSILHKLSIIIQLPLVIIFILFEELIWEQIAQPLYNKIKSLKVLQKIEVKLQTTHRGVILFAFIIILTVVEVAGLVAGVLFIQGKILLGLGLYLSKIPIAAFTFWLFKVTKIKLLSFGWFAWIYNKMISGFEWLKARAIYQKIMMSVQNIKKYIKEWFRLFKAKFVTKESGFTLRIKKLYRDIKQILKIK